MKHNINNKCRHCGRGPAIEVVHKETISINRLDPGSMSGMTPLFGRSAFTLIELLVVVLIIGVLTAIALPQYEKSVEKARATEALNTLMTAVKACKVYYLANGEYPTKFEDLDIQMPGEHKSDPGSSYIDFFETKNWRVALHGKGDIYNEMVAIFRLTGPYKGAAFHYAFNPNGWIEKDQIICSEIDGNGFSAPRDSYCKKIMGGTPDPGPRNSNYFYKLP